MNTLGDRVKAARESRMMTRLELAVAVQCSQGTLYLIEKGVTRKPRRELLEKIAEALGLSVNDLEEKS